MKSILLVSTPAIHREALYENMASLPFVNKKAMMVPLHLATIAGMTPDDIEVDIWDEPVHGLIDESTEFGKDYDLVAFTGYGIHLPRAKEVAQIFRKRGIPVAIGGVGVSASPETCWDRFDILFIGEAELTWPRFISDWRSGHHRKIYRQLTKPDLAASPIPKWDSIAEHIPSYSWGAVQTSRGCPFDCEFCEVVSLFGRRPRQKPIEHVLEEVSNLQKLGSELIFFCDDNFAGSIRYAKDLLRELISLNRSFPVPIGFFTSVTVNVARDQELLELLADANFEHLFIGIESPNKDSLQGANKMQNARTDLVRDVKKIQSYGLCVRASMIVGFDHDDQNIFDEHFDFLQETCTPLDSPHVLGATKGTKVWKRLRRENRLIASEGHETQGDLYGVDTNIIPKLMSRVELFSGYLNMLDKACDWSNFEARVKGFIDGIAREPQIPRPKNDGAPEQIVRTMGFLSYVSSSLDQEAQMCVRRLLAYVRLKAPFMRKAIVRLLTMQFSRVRTHEYERRELLKRIELENSEDFVLDMEQSEELLPENLDAFLRCSYPDIHARCHADLQDKSLADEAVARVFAEFFDQWKDTIDALLSEQQEAALQELVNQVVSDINNESGEYVNTNTNSETPDLGRPSLRHDVVQNIERELRLISAKSRKLESDGS